MRLIDADAFKVKIVELLETNNEPYSHYCDGYQDAVEWIDDLLDAQLTIEPVKRGKWELDKNRGLICCTNCGGEKPLKYLDNGTFHKQSFLSPYCPNCGAKMDGDD